MVREALTPEGLDGMEAGEAAALIVARKAEGLSPSEADLLNSWLASSDVNRREFERATRAWNAFDAAPGDEILAAMREHARAQASRRPQWQSALAVAATLALVVGASFIVLPSAYRPVQQANNEQAAIADLRYASGRGEVKEIKLPDGSTMSLDADSLVTGRFTDQARSLSLMRGRAFFAVVPNASRPFAVSASSYRAVAIGTRFEVNLADAALTVTLLEGHLRVDSASSGTRAAYLEQGQEFVVRTGAAKVRRADGGGEPLGWRSGLLEFDDQPLSEAIAIVNRYSNQQIVVGDPAVGKLKVSGQFRAGDPERFARTFADLHGLAIARKGTRIEIGKGG